MVTKGDASPPMLTCLIYCACVRAYPVPPPATYLDTHDIHDIDIDIDITLRLVIIARPQLTTRSSTAPAPDGA